MNLESKPIQFISKDTMNEYTCNINLNISLQSFFILVEELVQLEQLTDVTLACGDGTNHQVDQDAKE